MMAKKEFSGQEEQVNLIIENIREKLNNKLSTSEISTLVGKVIQMKEKNETEDGVKTYISFVTGIDKMNPSIDSILAEITEAPFEHNYFPFRNPILEQMKKDLEKE